MENAKDPKICGLQSGINDGLVLFFAVIWFHASVAGLAASVKLS
jgi:hypothetical protein